MAEPIVWYKWKFSFKKITPAIIDTIVDILANTADLEASILDNVKLARKYATIDDNIPKYKIDKTKLELFKGSK